jgi:hypothetical protein
LARVFEPYFTTKEVGRGSGLGLSMVQGFAAQSEGTVRISSRLGEGTTVELWLPRAEDDLSVEPIPESFSDWDRNGRAKGAFSFAMMTAMFARSSGEYCEILVTRSGRQTIRGVALQILKDANLIDVSVVDYAMPGMNGAALIDAARVTRTPLMGAPHIGSLLRRCQSCYCLGTRRACAMTGIGAEPPFG